MDPRRSLPHEYGRSRGSDGGGYGTLPSSSGRAIPPTAVPSLSTGQGFYTVESLQGATVVPPPQPAPPPPRFMPRLEPHARDLPPPHLHLAQRADFGPFDRRYPPAPMAGPKMMMMPPPDMHMPRRVGPGMLHHRPVHPPFMADPRMSGFHPGRFDARNGWRPADFERRAFDRSRDRVWASQRIMAKKQGQKLGKKSLADKQNAGEGGPGWCALCKIDCSNADSLKMHVAGKRHKKQVETQGEVTEQSHITEEAKEGVMATVSEQTKDNEGNEAMVTEGVEEDDHALEATILEVPKEESGSQMPEAKSIAGKKRALKGAENPKKKICKTPALSDATNGLAVITPKGSEDVCGDEIQTTSDLEVVMEHDLKGSDNASQTSITGLKGDADELPTSEKKSISESVKDLEDGAKEVRNLTNLANGSAEQSAQIQ